MAIFALAAAGLNLLVGRLGLVSLGHAAFFGLGAYAAALTGIHGTAAGGLTLAAGVAAAVCFAALTAPFVLRSHGIFFLMLTLAFSQMLHAAAQQWIDVTGGSNGLAGVPPLEGPLGLHQPGPFYGFSLLILGLVLWLLRRLEHAPFGKVLEAIHHGEDRARALGYPAFWYKFWAFLLSGAATGLAGALHAHHTAFVSPQHFHWATSGALLVMVLLGGRGVLWGSALGAAVYIGFEAWVSSWTELWHLAVGLLLIGVVLGSRKGLWGLVERGWIRSHG